MQSNVTKIKRWTMLYLYLKNYFIRKLYSNVSRSLLKENQTVIKIKLPHTLYEVCTRLMKFRQV